MDNFFASVVTNGGVVAVDRVEVHLSESVILTDAIFDPLQTYELCGPDGWRSKVRFVGQTFIRSIKPVLFRMVEGG